ncbi:hypothetical protein OF83DRAFT_1088597 [Amylostereum chailletii]|nr:hypothetical protein OF83DRAFT_1088597 [Amylostereum chailletii]
MPLSSRQQAVFRYRMRIASSVMEFDPSTGDLRSWAWSIVSHTTFGYRAVFATVIIILQASKEKSRSFSVDMDRYCDKWSINTKEYPLRAMLVYQAANEFVIDKRPMSKRNNFHALYTRLNRLQEPGLTNIELRKALTCCHCGLTTTRRRFCNHVCMPQSNSVHFTVGLFTRLDGLMNPGLMDAELRTLLDQCGNCGLTCSRYIHTSVPFSLPLTSKSSLLE